MSVDFEPTRLGSRRRRFDPLAVGVVAVSLAMVAAVAKPWGGELPAAVVERPDQTAAEPASPPPPSEAPIATVPVPRIVQVRSSGAVDDAAIQSAIRSHESWGIRVVMLAPGSDGPPRRLVERWFRLPAGGTRPAEAAIDVGDVEIVALGVTFPPAQMPLDVRIWLLGDAGPEWIDTQAIDTVASGGAFTYIRPGVPGRPPLTGRQRQSWDPGTYRLDVLVNGGIRTVGARIFEADETPATAPTPSTTGPTDQLVAARDSGLPDITLGMFATVAGGAIALDGVEGPALDATGAWLNLDAGTGRAPRSFVSAAYLPRATGLGVMLPPGSVVRSTSLERLAPEPLPGEPPRIQGESRGHPVLPEHVLFAAPNDGAWPPGVYRISVDWTDPEGSHDRSWHVELRPGPLREPPRMLAAARAWARYAGGTGVILGTVEPLVGGPRSAVIRMIPLRPEADYPADSGVGCGGTAIAGRPQVLGFAHPMDQPPDRVEATIRRPYLRAGPVVLNTALGLPGLALVAPARASEIAEANYEFVVASGETATSYVICHGMSDFDDAPLN